jgi:hypothetical protein
MEDSLQNIPQVLDDGNNMDALLNFLCEVVCPLLIRQHMTKKGLLKGACCFLCLPHL